MSENLRTAATLVLVRPRAPSGIDVLMVERPSRGAFGGLHVFPGGKVDGGDALDEARSRGRSDRDASRILGVARGGLAFWIAAIRESFEEAGVLFGYVGGHLVDLGDRPTRSRFEAHRRALIDGSLTLEVLCELERVTLATDRIHYFSHWITPIGAPARFDTRFFLAVMPPEQSVTLHANELERAEWIAPADALGRHRAGGFPMIHPTLTTLETLARYRDVDRLVEDVSAWRHLPDVTDEKVRQGMQRSR